MNPMLQTVYEQYFDKHPYVSKIVALDVECTSLGNEARIFEIGAGGFEYDGLNLNYIEFNSFVNPHMSIPEKIVELTHITDDMVVNAPEDQEVFRQLAEWLAGAKMILMHNAPFDSRILRHNYCRVGMDFNPFELYTRCTLQEAKAAKLPITSMKLGDVAEYFNYKNEQAHRALHDALATLYIHAKMSLR